MCRKTNFTIVDFLRQFRNDDECLEYIFNARFSDKQCERCHEHTRHDRITTRKAYQCSKCYHHVYPCAGTIFQKSRVPLFIWFYIINEFATSKNGMSAMEVQRKIGGSYKTALRMLHKIRSVFAMPDFKILFGSAEMDETFVGGKNVNRHKNKKIKKSQGRSHADKDKVFGIFHRETKMFHAKVVPDTSRTTIQPLVHQHINHGLNIFTDEWTAYTGLDKFYEHQFVNHQAKEYCDGENTTNRVENAWSCLKRTIKGSYIHVSSKHLQAYVNEIVFKFNARQDDKPIFYQIMDLVAARSS